MFSFKSLIDNKGGALIMGILNVTPDSFSDGGETFSLPQVLEKVKEFCDNGADIIDIGACSTAPDNTIVSLQEEIARLQMFLPDVINRSSVPVSVDTFRPEVAEYALSLGACIVNDESGYFNQDMAQVVKSFGAGWVFMHTGGADSRNAVNYPQGVACAVLSYFNCMKQKALEYGISECQLCYDCGIGFGKTRDDDLSLLAECDKLSAYSPLLVGVSRKRVIGCITGIENPAKRDFPSAVAAALAVADGAQIVRVHNVAVTRYALQVYGAVDRGVL